MHVPNFDPMKVPEVNTFDSFAIHYLREVMKCIYPRLVKSPRFLVGFVPHKSHINLLRLSILGHSMQAEDLKLFLLLLKVIVLTPTSSKRIRRSKRAIVFFCYFKSFELLRRDCERASRGKCIRRIIITRRRTCLY